MSIIIGLGLFLEATQAAFFYTIAGKLHCDW